MKVVPDSNLIVALVISLPYSQAASDKMRQWQQEKTDILVPFLWSYEIVSTLRKAVAIGNISSEDAAANLQDIVSYRLTRAGGFRFCSRDFNRPGYNHH